MIGNAYDRFTEKLGIGPGLFKAGSLMGLAAYGKPSPLLSSRGEEFCRGWYERSFQTSDPVFIDYMWSVLTGRPPHANFSLAESDSKEAMEIAATIQALFEETLLRSVHRLYRDTEAFADGHLCLSGGSCLNANANMRILNESPFARVHLFPGCGDDGTAVGAALFAAHNHFSLPRVTYEARELMYLGREYPAPEGGRDCSVDELAQSIADGKVVAWMQGRSEFGPRALGNRSLLADPRNPEMRDHLNHGVKKREWYRPFAPVVMEEHADEWFDINVESKFMLYIARVKHPERVPAISHVDGTARLQTVAEKDNPRLYGLLKAFKEKTGVPMLVNTSLNGNGEPLVETPEDLFRFASQTTVDRLIINGWDYSVLQKS
jgi:carbamoyltransferase